MLLRYLLVLATVVAAAVQSAVGSSNATGVYLEPLSNWEVTEERIPVRQNVFCQTSLDMATRSSDNDVSESLRALCSRQKPGKLFSSSALDAFMAARFVDYNTRLNSTIGQQPNSTEPNTPWMLADVVMETIKEQRRADSWRKVRGSAQLDLLLCSDPKCAVLVDVVKVVLPGVPSPRWSMATTGVAASSFQTGIGTANSLATHGTKVTRRDWVPRDLLVKGEANKTRSGTGIQISEVVWRALGLTQTNMSCTKGTGREQRSKAHVLPFNLQADLAALRVSPWQHLNLGHYKVNQFFETERSRAEPDARGCMTVIWPNHSWWHSHGFGASDPDCEHAFKRTRGYACSGYSKENNRAPQVLIFDSMFTQAHVMMSILDNGRSIVLDASADNLRIVQGDNITSATVAIVLPALVNLSDALVLPTRDNYGVWIMPGGADIGRYFEVAGRLGKTIQVTSPSSLTQKATGCLMACNSTLGNCGSCMLLSVGTATFAAVPEPGISDLTSKAPRWWCGKAEVALKTLVDFHLRGMWRDADGKVFGEQEVPWCQEYTWGTQESWEGAFITTVQSNVTMPIAFDEENQVFVGSSGKQAVTDASVNLVSNCSSWDQKGIGFINGAKPTPSASIDKASTLQTIGDAAIASLWPLELEQGDQDGIPAGILGYDAHRHTQLVESVARLVDDAAHLLDQLTAQELATTDSTKTWLGALWDMSVVILGIVAMGSGRSDMEGWIAAWLGRLWPKWASVSNGSMAAHGVATKSRKRASLRVAKVCYCCLIVPLAVIMAPAIVLNSDMTTRGQNSMGDNSKIGLLATEVLFDQTANANLRLDDEKPTADGISGEDVLLEPYILVGVLTVSTAAEYDTVALAILWANLIMAVAGTILIMAASYRRRQAEYVKAEA